MTLDPLNSEAVLDRLLTVTGLHKDAQLARLLGVSPQAVSQARRKQKIPESWLARVATLCSASLDWLRFGVGTPHIAGWGVPAGHTAALSRPDSALSPQVGMPDIDILCVPLVTASLSAGAGSLETDGEVLDYFAFRTGWLCRKGNPDKMVLMKVYGDSMEPEIRHGDMALIDQSKQQIYPHTIYAVGVNEEIYIKQVETRPGHHLILRSLNIRYDPIEVDMHGDMSEAVRIIGKVIWWCREV